MELPKPRHEELGCSHYLPARQRALAAGGHGLLQAGTLLFGALLFGLQRTTNTLQELSVPDKQPSAFH
jgi:hypothetical protein